MHSEDAQIIAGICDPDLQDQALRQLVQLHGAHLHAQIRKVVGIDDADDVFQNTLIKVLKNAGQFDGRSALKTWLFRIASNEALDFLRARARRTRHLGPSLQDANHKGESQYQAEAALPEGFAIQDLVLEAIQKLPDQQKSVFEARYFHETPYAELAQSTGKTENSLKVNFHHALRKVSDYLRAYAQNMPI